MTASAAPALSRPVVETETPFDARSVDALVLAAFGPGRFAKTAERLREGATPAAGFVVREAGRLVGSVRLWPIRVGAIPALFLGPIAVAAAQRSAGLGAALVEACLNHARAVGAQGVLLVGDPPYFARFGFAGAPAATLPGPADPRRVMWLPLSGVETPVGKVGRG